MNGISDFGLFGIAVGVALISLLSYEYVNKTGVFKYKYGGQFGLVIGAVTVYCVYKILKIPKNTLEEHYGGPIRNTKKIPMTDCYSFCDTKYQMCNHMYRGDNVGKCDAQWRACRMECYFPNVQRM